MPITSKQLQEMQPSPEEAGKALAEFHDQMFGNGFRSRVFTPLEEKAAIASLQETDQTDFQQIAASKLTLDNSYYNNALHQSQQSFFWALVWTSVGAVFIVLSAALITISRPDLASSIILALLGGTGGIGSGTFAHTNLQLYKQASDHAAACHIRLGRASDFILANSACEGLEGPEKKLKRSEIISKFMEL